MGYELVPETYRQKFRKCRKENDQTYVDFARTKEQLFDRWCSSKKNTKNHTKNEPVLSAPNFAKECKLAVDTSDTGACSVLLQENSKAIDHPLTYCSKTFNKHRKNYSVIEKECLSLILALQHFEVYLTSSSSPTVVFSDHSPLTSIHKVKNKNQRLLR